MNIKANQEELSFFDELRSAGVPIDGEALQSIKDANCGLQLWQSPMSTETEVFDIRDGGTGYMLGIWGHNGSNHPTWLHAFRLEIPWYESEFRWLEKPWTKVPREHDYEFPGSGLAGFDPSVVLNHRVGSTGKLLPGDEFDGLLLGIGREPIPEGYVDHQAVWMRLTVVDQRANACPLKVKFLVCRDRPRSRRGTDARQTVRPQKISAVRY